MNKILEVGSLFSSMMNFSTQFIEKNVYHIKSFLLFHHSVDEGLALLQASATSLVRLATIFPSNLAM